MPTLIEVKPIFSDKSGEVYITSMLQTPGCADLRSCVLGHPTSPFLSSRMVWSHFLRSSR